MHALRDWQPYRVRYVSRQDRDGEIWKELKVWAFSEFEAEQKFKHMKIPHSYCLVHYPALA